MGASEQVASSMVLTDVRVAFWDEWHEANARAGREGYGNPCLETKRRLATKSALVRRPEGGLPCNGLALNVGGLQTVQRWSMTHDSLRVELLAVNSTSVYSSPLSGINKSSFTIVPVEQANGARLFSLFLGATSGRLNSVDAKGKHVDLTLDRLELVCMTRSDAENARDRLLTKADDPRPAFRTLATDKMPVPVRSRRFVPDPAPHRRWDDCRIGGTRDDLFPHLLRGRTKI
jgi:hypothetical protein